ncbi:hypothetical protein [Microtetraspora malaysiensis]|uniref:hypothetical protein n=1 Tax=Microtetraspora malaysiensis TaxID=161358 RepID=UPI003D900C4B
MGGGPVHRDRRTGLREGAPALRIPLSQGRRPGCLSARISPAHRSFPCRFRDRRGLFRHSGAEPERARRPGAARAAGPAARAAGSAGRAGWTLVVVASDPRQPYGQAAVLETASLLRGGRPLNVTLGGLGAGGREARLEVLSWPGKAGPRRNAVTLRGQSPVLTVLTRKDVLLFGLAAISVPTLP